LKVNSFIPMDLIGSNGALDNILKTKDRSHVGMSFPDLAE